LICTTPYLRLCPTRVRSHLLGHYDISLCLVGAFLGAS
jgi:hypothetical protein